MAQCRKGYKWCDGTLCKYCSGFSEALKTLAIAMRKVLSPEEVKDLAYACDPFNSFLKDLQAEDQ